MDEEPKIKDKFWLYVSCTIFVIITAIFMRKQSENDKFTTIKKQLNEEIAMMNIRALK
jgi:hypothetical protein